MQLTRRHALAAGAAAATSGCAGVLNQTLYEAEKRRTLDSGAYWHFRFELDEAATVEWSVDVVDGPNVDVIVVESDEFVSFQEEESFQYYDDGSALDTGFGDRSVTVESGATYLVIDNSSRLEASPGLTGEQASVKVQYSVSPA